MHVVFYAFALTNSSTDSLIRDLLFLQLAENSAVADSPMKANVLEQRRCLLLAVTGSTAEVIPRSPTLKAILEAGFLVQVKSWLDDVLAGTVGKTSFDCCSTCYLH